LSRCLQAIPSNAENKSRFLVGSYTSKNEFLHTVTYDADKNDLNIKEVINFEKAEKDEKKINEVIGIYNPVNVEDAGGLNNYNDVNFFVQVFNESDRKYQLKFITNLDGEDGITYHSIKASDSDNIFEYF
jgi:hypothetical protein